MPSCKFSLLDRSFLTQSVTWFPFASLLRRQVRSHLSNYLSLYGDQGKGKVSTLDTASTDLLRSLAFCWFIVASGLPLNDRCSRVGITEAPDRAVSARPTLFRSSGSLSSSQCSPSFCTPKGPPKHEENQGWRAEIALPPP